MNTGIKKNSLMFKTMSILIFFSVIILILLYSFQILFTNYFYEKYKIRQVNEISNNINRYSNNLNSYFNKVSVENDVCIQVINPKVNILYNENMKGCVLNNPNEKLSKLMENMYSSNKLITFYKINNPKYNTKTFLYGKRLPNNSYIFINSQLESLDKTTKILSSQLIYLLLIVIILAIVLAYFISNTITKPIIEITKKAKKMGEGNLDVYFKSSNISEINELSETLNYTRKELMNTDDYRRDLMANVGHDLKTPLTLIRSYAEMVRDLSYKDDKKRTEHLNVIINETDRLNNLVGDIISMSKLESNADTLQITEYDLIGEIKNIISKFQILEITENYNFIYSGPENIMVKADKNKINQVVYNLLNNAINYTGDDMNVYINVIEKRKEIVVEIIDTGKGIEKDIIDHIWDRYYKTEKKHKRNKVGTGLGLNIVKEILEAHKFVYGVNSKIGEGTTFYFKIKKN